MSKVVYSIYDKETETIHTIVSESDKLVNGLIAELFKTDKFGYSWSDEIILEINDTENLEQSLQDWGFVFNKTVV